MEYLRLLVTVLSITGVLLINALIVGQMQAPAEERTVTTKEDPPKKKK